MVGDRGPSKEGNSGCAGISKIREGLAHSITRELGVSGDAGNNLKSTEGACRVGLGLEIYLLWSSGWAMWVYVLAVWHVRRPVQTVQIPGLLFGA